MQSGTIRGAVVAAAVVAAAVGVSVISSVAAGSSNASSFVPMAPCRLFDTRPAPDNIGLRTVPLGAGDVFTVDTWGTNGNCNIPTGATALSLNVVAIGPTASSYLTVYPGGNARPTASSLNWTAGQAPTPNAVTAALNGTGQLSFFNLAGSVNIAADVVGYYEPSTSGPAGATGPAGPQGAPGVDPAKIIWVASSGGDFTTISAALASITDNDSTHRYVIKLAPGTYTENNGIDMKNYVDIEGSGSTSVIASNGSGSSGAAVRITGALHTELRDLAISSTGARGLRIASTTSNVDVRVSGVDITVSSAGLVRGVEVTAGFAEIVDVRVTASSSSDTTRGFDINSFSNVVIEGSTSTVRSLRTFDLCSAADVDQSDVQWRDVTLQVSNCGSTSLSLEHRSGAGTHESVRFITQTFSEDPAYGVLLDSVTASFDRVSVSVTGTILGTALEASGSTVVVRDSSITHGGFAVFSTGGSTIKVIDTVLNTFTSGMSGNCTNAMTPALAPFTCS